MDSRLKLTKKQQALVKRLIAAFDALKKENVGIVQIDADFVFFNKKDVLSIDEGCETYYTKEGKAAEYMDVDKEDLWQNIKDTDDELVYHYPYNLPTLYPGSDLITFDGDGFSVLLTRNKESVAYSEKNKLKELNAELEDMKNELQHYCEAIEDGRATTEKLWQKNVSKEIIDAEIATITTNKQHISKLKKKIAEQKKKIKGKKAEIKEILQ